MEIKNLDDQPKAILKEEVIKNSGSNYVQILLWIAITIIGGVAAIHLIPGTHEFSKAVCGIIIASVISYYPIFNPAQRD